MVYKPVRDLPLFIRVFADLPLHSRTRIRYRQHRPPTIYRRALYSARQCLRRDDCWQVSRAPESGGTVADAKNPAMTGLYLLTNYLKQHKCTDLEKCLAAELEQMEYIRQTTTPITGPPILKPSCPLPKPKRAYTPFYTLPSSHSASPYSSASTLSSFS